MNQPRLACPLGIVLPPLDSVVLKRGVAHELPIELSNPVHGQDVVLEGVRSLDGTVRLNQDTLQREVIIHPGETYRFVVAVTQTTYQPVALDHLRLQFRSHDAAYPISSVRLPIQPSLALELEVELTPLVTSPLGHRTEVVIRHSGLAEFRDVRVHIGPDELVSGMSLLRIPRLVRGDEARSVAVLRGPRVTFHITAESDYGVVKEEIAREVRPAPAQAESGFRLIDPRRLLADDVGVWPKQSDKPVPERRTAFVVVAGSQYRIGVHPPNEDAATVELSGTERYLNVLKDAKEAGRWEFLVAINRDQMLFCRLAEVYYEVRTGDRLRDGSIQLLIRTGALRRAYVAAALGLAWTLQGAWSLARLGQAWLAAGDLTEVEVANFALEGIADSAANAAPDPETVSWLVLQLLAIPLVWVLYTLIDEIRFRVLPTYDRIRTGFYRWQGDPGGSERAPSS